MSDKMHITKINNIFIQIINEFSKEKSIFGIPETDFYIPKDNLSFNIFGEVCDTPIGPAAGPHTQLTQNIISAYLTGGRFFELKTVQILDELTVEKPCIDSYDECYNVEWSQELKLNESLDEYIKAWFLLHLLKALFNLTPNNNRGFIFNMSVGYNLEGIKQERMQNFINTLINAAESPLFTDYKRYLLDEINNEKFEIFLKNYFPNSEAILNRLNYSITNISPNISNSVTLSTMHGCPPNEIESIAKYLLEEKGLHTYVKINPTLLGYDIVNNTLTNLGYSKIFLNEHSFENDLKLKDAIPMIERLQNFAKDNHKEFGVKLSNTLAVKNKREVLPGDEMYMSGRSLFPLTINVAAKLSNVFKGNLNISFSGGASIYNSSDIFKCGIFPITYATDLLKPGGYRRLKQIANKFDADFNGNFNRNLINLDYVTKLAENSLIDLYYKKEKKNIESIKVNSPLKSFDCFIAPCSFACPIHQDISEYIRLVEEKRFEEAVEVILSKNALPNITAHICDHQCMYHCTRWDYDSPIEIREYKKVAVEKGYDKFITNFVSKREKIKNNISVAVIGAGPSGLSASFFLAQAGFNVSVFEKKNNAGGVVQNIIPDFRLPQSAIDKDIDFIKQLGVNFIFNSKDNLSIEKLKEEGYKYIYISIGAERSNNLELEHCDTKLIDALEFLEKFNSNNSIAIGKTIAIVGGGNSAMDAARAAKRTVGVENVYLIYRRTIEFMPADKEEIEAALNDGVIFKELLQPIDFSGGKIKCQSMGLGEIDKDKRRKVSPIENKFEFIAVDSLITAIGESVDTNLLKINNLDITPNNKVIINKESNETSVNNVFVGGDALRGPSTVVESIADGKKVAESILLKENINIAFDKSYSNKFNLSNRIKDISMKKALINISDKFISTNKSACLECNIICNKCIDVCPNRANVAIQFISANFSDVNQILHLDQLCNECGNCETFCPHQGAPYRNKITLFKDKQDFEDSSNNGFYLITSVENVKAVTRLNSKVSNFMFSIPGRIQEEEIELDKETKQLKELIGAVITDYPYLINN